MKKMNKEGKKTFKYRCYLFSQAESDPHTLQQLQITDDKTSFRKDFNSILKLVQASSPF